VASSALAGSYSLQALTRIDPFSLVNIGLLAGGSYAFYTHPNLRRDTRIIASTAAATFALFGIETYAIKVCQNKNATDRNDEEGSTAAFVRRFVHDYAPRSGVIGGTTGVGKSIQCTC
jgi:hypothetical protein